MKVKLGYELGTGEEVGVEPSHMIVCGVSQKSGKTTTIEAFVARSGKQAIIFKTKPGEKVFNSNGQTIPAFFRGRNDYEFIRALLESSSKERLNTEKTVLMELCQGATSLDDLKKSVDNSLVSGAKIRRDVYIRLQHYLDNLIPHLKKAQLSKSLVMNHGVNIMDLEDFSEEIQALVIQSTLDEILKNHHDVLVVLPEMWRFTPEKRNTPCKQAVESFIRQGATNNNFVVMDSQDLAGVDKIPLKQVSCYLLGYQAEINEVKHTLNQIPLPVKSKPTPDAIMTLKVGQFYLADNTGMKKIYIQPLWLNDVEAKATAISGILSEKKPEQKKIDYIEVRGGNAGGKSSTLADEISHLSSKNLGKEIYVADDLHSSSVPSRVIPPETIHIGIEKVLSRPPMRFPAPEVPEEMAQYDVRLISLRNELLNKIEELEMKIRSNTPTVYMVSPSKKSRRDSLKMQRTTCCRRPGRWTRIRSASFSLLRPKERDANRPQLLTCASIFQRLPGEPGISTRRS
jgi:hypothetical protein